MSTDDRRLGPDIPKPPSLWVSLWRGIVLAADPVKRAGVAANWLFGLSVAGAIGALIYFVRKYHLGHDLPWLLFGAACLLLILFVVATWRLQYEKDQREHVNFAIAELVPEFIPNITDAYVGGAFRGRTIILVKVTNFGPPAEFSAEFGTMTGAAFKDFPGGDVSTYSHPIAWEDTINREQHLVRNEEARLCVAFCFREPLSLWMMTPYAPLWRSVDWTPDAVYGTAKHNPGRALVPNTASQRVEFDITVHNRTGDKRETKHAVLQFALDGSVAFELQDKAG